MKPDETRAKTCMQGKNYVLSLWISNHELILSLQSQMMVVSQYSQPWEDICPLFIGSRTYTSSVYAGEASHSVAVAPQFTPLTLDGALTGRWWHWQWRGKQPQSHYGRSEAKLGEQFSRRSSFRCLRRSTFSAVSLSSSMISFSFLNLSWPDVSRRLASSITNSG